MVGFLAPLIGGAVSLIGGLASRNDAKKQAKAQNQLQQQQIDMAQDRINDYNKNYGPLEQMLIERAQKGAQADLGGVTARVNADVAQQYANSEATRLRNLSRIGLNPNSGRADSVAMDLSLAKAKALAGGLTTARENERRSAENQAFDLQAKVAQIGVNKLNGAQSNLDSAMSNMANTYGNRATNSANMSNAMIGNAVDIGGRLLGDYIEQRNNTVNNPAWQYQHQVLPIPTINPNIPYVQGQLPAWHTGTPLGMSGSEPVIMDKIDNNKLLSNSA